MKKLIALFLALMLVFSLATVCFADQGLSTGDSPTGDTIPDEVGPHDENVDNSLTSPDTGVVSAAAVMALVLGFAGVTVSGKKLFD